MQKGVTDVAASRTFAAWQAEPLAHPDGSIALYKALPERRPRAVVHINHGMAEHAARYGRFAHHLTAAGYAVFAHDHPGHGATAMTGASQGYFAKREGWQHVIDTVRHVQDEIARLQPGVPLVMFGHSMGAIVTLSTIIKHPEAAKGAAIWNSGVERGPLLAVFRGILKAHRMFKGSDTPSTTARKLTFDAWNKSFAPNRTDFDWLSRDDAEVDAYVEDPLCGFDVTCGMWLDVTDGIAHCADDNALRRLPQNLPIHLLAGAADPCSQNGKAVAHIAERMRAQGMGDVTFDLLDETRHESLNEINRDETTRLFIEWLDARYPQR